MLLPILTDVAVSLTAVAGGWLVVFLVLSATEGDTHLLLEESLSDDGGGGW